MKFFPVREIINIPIPTYKIQPFSQNIYPPQLYPGMINNSQNVEQDYQNAISPYNQNYQSKSNSMKKVSYEEKYPEVMESYKIINPVGFGRFAKVYKGEQKRGDCRVVAIKIIQRKANMEKHESPYSELTMLQGLDHENIVRLFSHIDTSKRLTLIFELAEKGDLFQLLEERGPLSESHAASVVSDVGEALFYLHNQKYIIHRNIKLENILIFNISRYHINCKLSDFGLAVKASEPISEICGSVNYISPEMVEKKEYTFPIDMWALGVVCYILLSAFPPFYAFNGQKEEIIEKIKNCDYSFPPHFWNNISSECKNLIDKLLHYNPEKRINSLELLCCPWIISKGACHEKLIENLHVKSETKRHSLLYLINPNRDELIISESKPEKRSILESLKLFFTKPSEVKPINPILGSNFINVHKRQVKVCNRESDLESWFP